jgi:pyruvate/2-oxoglutarate dehydrogenase complex dihydrolipoamide dehydrogenase (E3) component
MKTSTSTEECDLLVLGSGTGGKVLGGTFPQKGQRVVVVERKYVGGSRLTSARTTSSWTSTETTKSYKETDREEGNYPRRTV